MTRDTKLDNLKTFLIFTVVFGHALEFWYGVDGAYGVIRSVIYSFHMPAFVFLSGYFSVSTKKPTSHITISYLCTYIGFNTLFALTPWRVASPLNFFYPQIIYWYILSLWIWRVGASAITNIRFVFPISVLLTLYIGCFQEAGRFLAMSRTICFLPFFLAGYYFRTGKTIKINKLSAMLLSSICFFITASLNILGIIPVEMYEYIQCYKSTGVDKIDGVFMRLGMVAVSLVLIICLISLSPTRNNIFTSIGRNSLTVYLVHIFFIKLIASLGFADFGNIVLNVFFSFSVSLLICFLLSRQIIADVYNKVVSKLVNAFAIA